MNSINPYKLVCNIQGLQTQAPLYRGYWRGNRNCCSIVVDKIVLCLPPSLPNPRRGKTLERVWHYLSRELVPASGAVSLNVTDKEFSLMALLTLGSQ